LDGIRHRDAVVLVPQSLHEPGRRTGSSSSPMAERCVRRSTSS
jgi:hypothetical protein